MRTKVNLSKVFKPRMFLLALVTGMTITLSMPLTYFSLAMKECRQEAQNETQRLIQQMQNSIIANPDLWFYSFQKYLQILTPEQNAKIIRLKSFDQNRKLLQVMTVNPTSRFVIREKTVIKLNNQIYGYLEIIKNADAIWDQSLILLVIFTALGSIVGMILYRFPLKIVLTAEQEINHSVHKLEKLSFWDTLTGLPNRHNLLERLKKMIHTGEKSGGQFAFLLLNFNRFKLVNNNFGHTVGDLLLQAFVLRMTPLLADRVFFARNNGDEFVMILPDPGPEEVTSLYKKIAKELEKPFLLDEHEIYITVSLGVSRYPNDARDSVSLFISADLALHHAKHSGKNQLTFTTALLQAEAQRKLTVENGLRKALQNGEIIPFFQPIVAARTGTVIGFEALARWIHPKDGIIPPDRFIPIAEETGIIVPLGLQIMKLACEALRSWHERGYQVSVSVNLSVRQLLQFGLPAQIDMIINTTGIDPRYLQLEITESVAVENEAEMVETLKAIHEKGIRIAIDDFGTAYSSLGKLKYYLVDVLKIDRSFIAKIPFDHNDIAITNFIVNLAHNLAVKVVAEGVETAAQVGFLQEINCDELQGYFFSKPLPPEDTLKLLSEDQPKFSLG
jgi:diguanylate cyclase (GGDEF)-like protein